MDITPVAAEDRPRPVPAPPPSTRSEARAALKDSAGVGLGFLPLGLAFGALVTQSGLDWWWAGLTAALVFGGSFEFPYAFPDTGSYRIWVQVKRNGRVETAAFTALVE